MTGEETVQGHQERARATVREFDGRTVEGREYEAMRGSFCQEVYGTRWAQATVWQRAHAELSTLCHLAFLAVVGQVLAKRGTLRKATSSELSQVRAAAAAVSRAVASGRSMAKPDGQADNLDRWGMATEQDKPDEEAG